MPQKKKKVVKESMTFAKIMKDFPETIEVLLEKGMHCIGCPAAISETIKQGAEIHGLDVKELVKEMNDKIEK